MLSYNDSLKILKDTDALLEGHFILSSGLHSSKYIQCAKLLSHPKKAQAICKSLTEKIKKKFKRIDLILSPALGGIVIGYEIGRQLNIQTIFAERKKNKFILRRGFNIPEKSNVLIVEDVITTGKSSLECSKLISRHKGNILGFACIIDRSTKNLLKKKTIVSQIRLRISVYKKNKLPKKLISIHPNVQGSGRLFK